MLNDHQDGRRLGMDSIEQIDNRAEVGVFMSDGVAQTSLPFPVGGRGDDSLLLHECMPPISVVSARKPVSALGSNCARASARMVVASKSWQLQQECATVSSIRRR
ncbi:hypothetical protein [Thiocapsa imhoffii]|uniref:hypothetical protein n=1 Tax=Thiocapsa imhoffii TaxID=382777 RepID=UPI001905D55E|nr:hypothetical protein [Thiocapsa imhoffii]